MKPRTLALLALALLLAGQALAQKRPGPRPTPPPAPARAEPPELGALRQQVNAGDHPAVVVAGYVALSTPQTEPWREEIHGALGASLEALGLHQAALLHLGEVIRAGREAPGLGRALERAAVLSRQVEDSSVVVAAGRGLELRDLPQEGRSALTLALGADLCAQDHCLDAVTWLSTVPEDDPLYPAARAQMIAALVKTGQRTVAWTLHKDLMERHRQGLFALPGGEALAWMTAARLAYSMGQFEEASFAYGQVPRASLYWPDALLEQAWASYAQWQIKDSSRALSAALGNLMTLTSPALRRFYYPEAWLLMAQVDYYLCKPATGTRVIEDFFAHWRPVSAALSAALAQEGGDPLTLYQVALAHLQGGSPATKIPRAFLHTFLTDERFSAIEAHATHVEEELARLKGLAALPEPLRAQIEGELTGHVRALRTQQGRHVQQRLQALDKDLKVRLVETDIAHLSLITQEKDLYEAAAAGTLSRQKHRRARKAAAPAGSWLFTFEGEFWQDELGHYTVDAVSECPGMNK